MALTLYPYQREAVDAINGYFCKTGGNPLVVIPTGGGKSLIIGTFIQEALTKYPDTRILVLAHVPELISQNYAELIGFWPGAPAGIYSAKLGKRQIGAQVLFAGIQSIHRRAYNLQKVDVVIVDEAHLIPRTANTMYRRFLNDLLQINPRLKVTGLTATPFRLDSGELHKGEGAIFDDIAYEVNIRFLIENGFLSPLTSIPANRQIDLSHVGTSGGEFIPRQLEAAANDPETIAAIADEIVSNSAGRHSILTFGSGKQNCVMLADALTERGIVSDVVFGDTPFADRKRIVEQFKHRKLRSLVSLRVFTTGFNAKCVDMIALGTSTKSTGLYVQIVGRGTRLHKEKKDCLILDFGGNIERHGPIDRIKPAKEKKEKVEPGKMPEKICPHCETPNFIAARECVGCGQPFPPMESLIATQAAALDIMSRDDLLPQWAEVSGVSYAKHTKPGSPDSLRVTYQCGLIQHREWILLEHSGGMKAKAQAWWRKRAQPGMDIPQTITVALDLARFLEKPKQIAVRPSGKYTEVVGYRDFEREKVFA